MHGHVLILLLLKFLDFSSSLSRSIVIFSCVSFLLRDGYVNNAKLLLIMMVNIATNGKNGIYDWENLVFYSMNIIVFRLQLLMVNYSFYSYCCKREYSNYFGYLVHYHYFR